MTTFKIQTGYQVKKIQSLFCVMYVFADGKMMRMTDRYFKTELGATKAMQKIKMMAGAL